MTVVPTTLWGVIDPANRCITAHSSQTAVLVETKNMGEDYRTEIVSVTIISNPEGVRPGQIWRDRRSQRTFTVYHIERNPGHRPKAMCRRADGMPAFRIRLDRFSKDYTLVSGSS